jgi:hypothetical protein
MQVIKMSLKSNSGTSTSEDSRTQEDELLVKKSKNNHKFQHTKIMPKVNFPKILARSRSDLTVSYSISLYHTLIKK